MYEVALWKKCRSAVSPRFPAPFASRGAKPGHSRISSRGVATKVKQATRKGQRAVQKGKSPPGSRGTTGLAGWGSSGGYVHTVIHTYNSIYIYTYVCVSITGIMSYCTYVCIYIVLLGWVVHGLFMAIVGFLRNSGGEKKQETSQQTRNQHVNNLISPIKT